MVEFAVVILIHQRTTLKAIPQKSLDMKKEGDTIKPKALKSNASLRKSGNTKIKGNEQSSRILLAPHLIDFLSFWFHLGSFFIFNIVYWSKNL